MTDEDKVYVRVRRSNVLSNKFPDVGWTSTSEWASVMGGMDYFKEITVCFGPGQISTFYRIVLEEVDV